MNHFIEVVDTDGDTLIFRPDEVAYVVRLQSADWDAFVMKNGRELRIPRGKFTFNTLPERTMYAGVRVL